MRVFLEALLLIILILVFGYLFFYYADILFAPATKQNPENKVCFNPSEGENCFFVELVKTNTEREKGLMNRKELDKNKGMLFVFDKEAIYPFWMKNTFISLDIIWIDANGKVVFINENTKPCKGLFCPAINPLAKAKYVLEINAGISKEFNIKTGDLVEISPSL